jgi:hypothetical protein
VIPLDAELWDRAYVAVVALRAHFREDPNLYYRTAEVALDTDADAWPQPTVAHSVYIGDGPPDFQRTFLAERSFPPMIEVIVDDVEELAAFTSYVRTRHDLPGADPEQRTEFARHLTLGVAGRCEALDVPADRESVLAVYAQAERSVLAPTLTVDLVVPVLVLDFGTDEPIELADGVAIEPMTAQFQLARAPFVDGATVSSPRLVAAATHAVVVRDIEVDNTEPWPWRTDRLDLTAALDSVRRAFAALRVSTSRPTGHAELYLRPDDWADHWFGALQPVIGAGEVREYPSWLPDEITTMRRSVTRPRLRTELPLLYGAFDGSDRRLAVAVKRLELARLRHDHDDEVIDACIGLEALLGDSATEVTHRLAQRAAVLLSDPATPSEIYAIVKEIYGYRSYLVHGGHSARSRADETTFDGQRVRLCELAMTLLSKAIRRIVRSGPVEPKDLDRMLLDSFGGPGASSARTAEPPMVGGGWVLD